MDGIQKSLATVSLKMLNLDIFEPLEFRHMLAKKKRAFKIPALPPPPRKFHRSCTVISIEIDVMGEEML